MPATFTVSHLSQCNQTPLALITSTFFSFNERSNPSACTLLSNSVIFILCFSQIVAPLKFSSYILFVNLPLYMISRFQTHFGILCSTHSKELLLFPPLSFYFQAAYPINETLYSSPFRRLDYNASQHHYYAKMDRTLQTTQTTYLLCPLIQPVFNSLVRLTLGT